MLWILLFSPLCCSLLWGQAYKARDKLEPRTRHEGWLVTRQSSVNVLFAHMPWVPGHIWKCSWIEQCLNDGWEKGGNETVSPVWCFRDLPLSGKCCACLISEDILHPHHLPYSLGYKYVCTREGKKEVLCYYSWAVVYKVKKAQLGALDQSCFETGKWLPFCAAPESIKWHADQVT